jgi:two-component system chemotaxis response regulator CheB
MARTPKQTKAVVVIGTSAGGLNALRELMIALPDNFPAPIFIVQHLSPVASGAILVSALQEVTPLPCRLAKDQEPIRNGHILVAPPDHHLLLKDGHVLVTKGARENRSRPAIDTLFRSAAVAYGNRVIGVVLTGNLDDGTSGLGAIQACGGTCVVQDPKTAAYPDMPRSALENVEVDHCVPLAEIASLLQQLIGKHSRRRSAAPEEVILEAKIAERVISDVHAANHLGTQVPYNCPNCGGVLWQITKSKVHRYRCHTGHAFTASTLEASQLERIEETLWVCLRMMEERRNLLNTTATRERQKGFSKTAALQRERADESQEHIDRIRNMLLASSKEMSAGIPPKH